MHLHLTQVICTGDLKAAGHSQPLCNDQLFPSRSEQKLLLKCKSDPTEGVSNSHDLATTSCPLGSSPSCNAEYCRLKSLFVMSIKLFAHLSQKM